MKNKKVIWILALVLVLVFGISSGVTFAWLTQTGKAPEITYEVGEINYTFTKAPTSTTSPIVPGDDLGNIVIANTSNIKTNLRVLIEAKAVKTGTVQEIAWTVGEKGTAQPNKTDQVLITKQSNWVIDPSTNYLYYKSMTDASGIIAAQTAPESPFTNLCINGEVVGTEFEKATVTITITFQAKQADNVTWATIGQIDWTQGI